MQQIPASGGKTCVDFWQCYWRNVSLSKQLVSLNCANMPIIPTHLCRLGTSSPSMVGKNITGYSHNVDKASFSCWKCKQDLYFTALKFDLWLALEISVETRKQPQRHLASQLLEPDQVRKTDFLKDYSSSHYITSLHITVGHLLAIFGKPSFYHPY